MHGDGIFFTTDTHEIIANSATYGETIDEWEIADGILTLTMTSGKTVEITFNEATESVKGLLSAADKKKINSLDTELNKKVDKVADKSLVSDAEITKLSQLKTQDELDTAIADAKKAGTDAQSNINTHKADTSNPHKVTKAQVGLDKVDNTADADKVVASADKLTTPRTIWGQSFDGTADISGDITLDGAIISADTQLVDLGLPSGTLWMDRNIGASKPSDYGLYFAWGETQGYTADEVGSKKQFSYDDYKYANGSSSKFTKYCDNSRYGNDGYTDSLVTLEMTDDAVLQNVHKYSMPTKTQLQELLDNTTSEWTTQDGVNGRLFTSKTNSNSIFVPAAGFGYNGSMLNVGSHGVFWSSSLYESYPNDAWVLGLSSGDAVVGSNGRGGGRSVRGVATPTEGNSTINLPSTSGTLALDNVATTTSSGLMSSSDKSKLDSVAEGANNYSLPEATSSILGGVKVDNSLSTSSTNPVQNKIVKSAIDDIDTKLSWVTID